MLGNQFEYPKGEDVPSRRPPVSQNAVVEQVDRRPLVNAEKRRFGLPDQRLTRLAPPYVGGQSLERHFGVEASAGHEDRLGQLLEAEPAAALPSHSL